MRAARMPRVSLPPRLRLCLVPSRYCSASPALHLDRTKFLAAIGARRELAVPWGSWCARKSDRRSGYRTLILFLNTEVQ